VVAEYWGLEHSNLAVWTTFLVMSQYPFTSFQKGLERVLGRGVGILLGLALTTWLNDAPLLAFALIAILLTSFFYIYFSGRLAYTRRQPGLYLVLHSQIAHADRTSAVHQAEELFVAVVVGVVAADLVAWLAGSEAGLGIQVGTAPLWPLRLDWLNQSAM